jgi:hypothetical protein
MARVSGVCVVAGAVIACDQPTGLVVSVYGAAEAKGLQLTVGVDPVASNQPRFLQADESGVIPIGGPYSDGFEIYLDRQALQKQGQVALVLDAVVDRNGVDILRDTYVVEPTRGALVEVRLTPKGLMPGRWVCAGRARSATDLKGFATFADPGDLDCDRDGWFAGVDPDDADPLGVGKVEVAARDGQCGIFLGGHQLLPLNLSDCNNNCSLPLLPNQIEDCLSGSATTTICSSPREGGTFPVSEIADVGDNPDWELAKIGPAVAVNAYFAPSNRAPAEWAVTFSGVSPAPAWFVLTDRAHRRSTLIRVELGPGERSECKPK